MIINPAFPLSRSPNPVRMIEGYVERSEFNPTTQTHFKQTFPGAQVTVFFRKPDGVYDVATIYDRNGMIIPSSFQSNQTTAYYNFYAEPGTYDVVFTEQGTNTEITRLKDVKVESLVYNVRDYGARGNANAGDPAQDDAVAIRAAIAAMKEAVGGADANGIGTLFFPNGIYIVRTPIDLPSGIIVQGTNGQFSGNAGSNCLIILTEQNTSIFTIKSNRQRIAIRDLGMTTLGPDLVLPGTRAIEGIEDTPGLTVTGIEFDNLSIWGFDRGISVVGIANVWDFTYVRVNRCLIAECNYAIYLSSQTCDFWKIVDSRIGTSISGYGIYLAQVGSITIDNVLGAGAPHPNNIDPLSPSFIYITPAHGAITIINSECEDFVNSIEVAANVSGNISFPIVVLNSNFGNPISLGHNCEYVSIGNRYQPGTVRCVHNGTDVMIYSYGDIFFGNDATNPDPTSDFALIGNSRLVTRANRFRVDFQQPARFGGQAGMIPSTLHDIALAISPLAPDQVQLALCGPEGNLLFQVRVNSDYMDFENPLTTPSPTTLMRLDRRGDLTIRGQFKQDPNL